MWRCSKLQFSEQTDKKVYAKSPFDAKTRESWRVRSWLLTQSPSGPHKAKSVETTLTGLNPQSVDWSRGRFCFDKTAGSNPFRSVKSRA